MARLQTKLIKVNAPVRSHPDNLQNSTKDRSFVGQLPILRCSARLEVLRLSENVLESDSNLECLAMLTIKTK